MASSGPNGGASFTTEAAGGFAEWSNPSNAGAADSTYATATVTGLGGQSRALKATNFGFSIPTGATIDGILVEWLCSSSGGNVYTDRARIVKGGVTKTTEKSLYELWSGSYVSYGGASYLWGETWTVSDINDSGFGAIISAISGNSGSKTGQVDYVRITVYYTEAAAGGMTIQRLRQSRNASLLRR